MRVSLPTIARRCSIWSGLVMVALLVQKAWSEVDHGRSRSCEGFRVVLLCSCPSSET